MAPSRRHASSLLLFGLTCVQPWWLGAPSALWPFPPQGPTFCLVPKVHSIHSTQSGLQACPLPVRASRGGDAGRSSENTPQGTAPVPQTPARPSAQAPAAPSCPRAPSKAPTQRPFIWLWEVPPTPTMPPALPDCLVLFSACQPWDGRGPLVSSERSWPRGGGACPSRDRSPVTAGGGAALPPPHPWLLPALSRPDLWRSLH